MYDDYEEYEPKSFWQKLEDSVEPALKIIAYIIFGVGIVYSIVCFFAILSSKYINSLVALAALIGGIAVSYMIFCGTMFYLRIGSNIKRSRELLEKLADKNKQVEE